MLVELVAQSGDLYDLKSSADEKNELGLLVSRDEEDRIDLVPS